VENEIQIMHYILKMELISSLPKCIKLISGGVFICVFEVIKMLKQVLVHRLSGLPYHDVGVVRRQQCCKLLVTKGTPGCVVHG
jgi:hypothetical protein